MSTKEITVILTCQDQGRLLNPSIQSLRAAIRKAESGLGVAIEWIIAADTPSEQTEEYLLYNQPPRSRKLFTGGGCTAVAANQAVKEAEGKFIALVCGDDLVSSNWLTQAYTESSGRTAGFVFHPGLVVAFGETRRLAIPPDQEDPDFSRDVLFSRNLWPSVSLAAREVFLAHPFSYEDRARGFGHADWYWVCDTVAAGIVHKPLPGTLACCRQSKTHACVAPEPCRSVLMPPSKLFPVLKQCEV